jgi:hypothetical protein
VRLVAATETWTKSSSVVCWIKNRRQGEANRITVSSYCGEKNSRPAAEQTSALQAGPNRRTTACLRGKTHEQSTPACRNRASGGTKNHGALESRIRKSSGALREDSAPAAARTLAPRLCTRWRADERRHSGKETTAGFGTETRPVSSREKSNPGRAAREFHRNGDPAAAVAGRTKKTTAAALAGEDSAGALRETAEEQP